jgi:RNA polymerase sigma factor (sigma-70 family)
LTLAERQALAVAHLPLARGMARRFVVRHDVNPHFEEYEAPALAGLWDAARMFDPVKGGEFILYARRRIVGALIDHAHWLAGRPRTGSDGPVDYSAEMPDDAREDMALRQLAAVESLEAAIGSLSVAHRPLARLLLLDGLEPHEAAQRLGMSRSVVHRAQLRIMAHLESRRYAA